MVALEIKVNADERGLAKELDKTFRLTRFPQQAFVMLLRNHYDSLLALACDPLGPLGSCFSEDFAEAGLRALNLPGFAGRSRADIRRTGYAESRLLLRVCHALDD